MHDFSPCIGLTVVLACGTTNSSSRITNFVQVVNYNCQYSITLSFHMVVFCWAKIRQTVVVTARAEKCDNREYIPWIGKFVIFIEYVVSLLLYLSI